ncbi:MAG: hypothetical protein MJA27_13600 [Pseudanabaenales cyanobacterium]|nr:hypothetical protein [Pseudanabaenales cyanobacterium]
MALTDQSDRDHQRVLAVVQGVQSTVRILRYCLDPPANPALVRIAVGQVDARKLSISGE